MSLFDKVSEIRYLSSCRRHDKAYKKYSKRYWAKKPKNAKNVLTKMLDDARHQTGFHITMK